MSDLDKVKNGERQDYYGSGRQPWDDIMDMGWAAQFSAGNVLKYLRRAKEPEKDVEKAKWYYNKMKQLAKTSFEDAVILGELYDLLDQEEKDKLNG